MALNIFKRKSSAPKEVKEAKKPEVKIEKRSEKKKSLTYGILKSPRITEKATILGDLNQYTFEVGKNANKTEIKKAIEGLYNVDVVSVKVLNVPRKERRFKGKIGWASEIKKSIVKIKQGQKIEVLPR